VKRASRGVWRISKKSLLSGGGIFSEKGIEELKRGFTLTLSGDHQAWDNTLGEGSLWRASAEGYFSHDDLGAERLFGLVVGGLNTGDDKESKKAIIVLDGDADAERFCGLIIEWLARKSAETFLGESGSALKR